jgi:hypothetical protein
MYFFNKVKLKLIKIIELLGDINILYVYKIIIKDMKKQFIQKL